LNIFCCCLVVDAHWGSLQYSGKITTVLSLGSSSFSLVMDALVICSVLTNSQITRSGSDSIPQSRPDCFGSAAHPGNLHDRCYSHLDPERTEEILRGKQYRRKLDECNHRFRFCVG
jgi:hypothetical protein